MNKNSEFQNNIHQWINLDNKIKELLIKLDELKIEKNKIKNDIIIYSESNNINNSTIKCNNNLLKIMPIKHTQTLTFKFLKECLDDCINNKEQIDLLLNYIKNKRNTNIIFDIKRIDNK